SSFFFQAEDGIRDFHVTGVQTCALPILARAQGEGAHNSFGDLLCPGGSRCRGDDERVDTAELAVEGDGVGARGGEVEEEPPAAERSGEAHGPDHGMTYQGEIGRASRRTREWK